MATINISNIINLNTSIVNRITKQQIDSYLNSNNLIRDNIDRINIDTNYLYEIDDFAFSEFTKLKTFNGKTDFPTCFNRIGRYAFYKSLLLNNIIMFDSNCSVEDYAFAETSISRLYCSNLTKIPAYMAYNAKNLSKLVQYGDTILTASSIGNYSFYGTNITGVIQFTCKEVSIGAHSFENTNIIRLYFHNNQIIIHDYAFADNVSLNTIKDCLSIKSIGNYAFAGCTNFPSKIILNNCTEIGRYAFRGCENLESLIAPNCTFVDYNAFYDTKLWNVEPS